VPDRAIREPKRPELHPRGHAVLHPREIPSASV
jgi:hypothetical protein